MTSEPRAVASPPPSPAYDPWMPEGRVGDAVGANGSLVRRFLLERLRRLDPRGVHPVVLALSAALLVAWVVIAHLLLTPGLIVSLDDAQPTQRDLRHLGAWLVFVTADAMTVWALVVILLCKGPLLRACGVGVALLSTIGMAQVLALSSVPLELWAPWLGVLVPGAAAIALLVRAAIAVRGRLWLATIAGALLALQWAVVATLALRDPSDVVFVGFWTIYGFLMLIVLSVVTIGGVAEWAQRAHVSTDGLARRLRIRRWVPAVAAAAMIVIAVLRLTVLSDLFGEVDAVIWTVGGPSTWLQAALVAAVVVLLVVGSDRRPLRSRGGLLATTVMSAAAGTNQLLFAMTYLVPLALPLPLHAAAQAVTDAVAQQALWIALGISLLLCLLLLPRFRRSTGRVAAIVGLLTIVPFELTLLLPIPWLVASPTQVLPLVGLAALGLSIVGLARRRDVVDRVVLLRLAVVPTIAVHAGQLIPAALADARATPVLVGASLVGILLFGVARGPGVVAASEALVGPLAVQVALLGVATVGIAIGGDIDALTTMAVVYLAWPVATVLCCRIDDDPAR